MILSWISKHFGRLFQCCHVLRRKLCRCSLYGGDCWHYCGTKFHYLVVWSFVYFLCPIISGLKVAVPVSFQTFTWLPPHPSLFFPFSFLLRLFCSLCIENLLIRILKFFVWKSFLHFYLLSSFTWMENMRVFLTSFGKFLTQFFSIFLLLQVLLHIILYLRVLWLQQIERGWNGGYI